ncbi:hypothetical protein [Candidatus Nitrosocosmicus franklandus]|uniref:Uncharacterized protein n=1 Tax=Candidatus Nitrosocosmicus franklandianus TaxID=1798806 RepID=A0A484I921_9ARCH|nr:hypothetical protein [Candidatus Nitrosocosmicus franklandus]VFJ14261.1 conserved protein of unknown function [Candidatus Nitrosocosmicus franklandus]
MKTTKNDTESDQKKKSDSVEGIGVKKDKWLRNIKESWRNVQCSCGSDFHFDGDIDKLFEWENIHLRHLASDSDNHSIISFYPTDMIIYYHSKSGYVIERRKHKSHEISEINQSLMMGKVTMTGV